MTDALLDRILAVNLIGTTLVFYAAARIYLIPRLGELAPRAVMVPILLLHSLRHLGLMFLTRGATYPGIPASFTVPAAIGDFLTAILAFLSIPLVLRDWNAARRWVLIFNVVGTLDLASAITLATVYDAAPWMGPAYWIPAFWVPALLVTHYVTFLVLRRARAAVRFSTVV
jgi:hypothetical protein